MHSAIDARIAIGVVDVVLCALGMTSQILEDNLRGIGGRMTAMYCRVMEDDEEWY